MMPHASEDDVQIALFEWAAVMEHSMPGLRLMYHVPNGGRRSISEAVRFKAMGVKPGVPDVCLPVARGGYHGLYVEIKVGRNKPSDNQLRWIDDLRAEGYQVALCYGLDAAIDAVTAYMRADGP